jgi:hypothetical protein
MRGIIILAVWLLALGFSNPSLSEEQGGTEQSKQDRRRLVADNLPLTETEAQRFWPLYERFEQDISNLAEQRKAIINKLGEHYDDMSDAMAKQLVLGQLNYQEDRLKLMKAYLPRFEKTLPAKKLARFYQIEGRIRAAIEAEIAERIPLIK